jgi:hypothetical protein
MGALLIEQAGAHGMLAVLSALALVNVVLVGGLALLLFRPGATGIESVS